MAGTPWYVTAWVGQIPVGDLGRTACRVHTLTRAIGVSCRWAIIAAIRGRKPKPILQQIIEGDPRKRGRLNLAAQATPQPLHGLPPCPGHLHGHAKAAWNLWRGELETMGLDAGCDAAALAAACMKYESIVRAHAEIQKQGEVISEPILSRDTGKIIGHRSKKNPWLNVREHAHKLLLSFCSEFGLSPAARTRLNITAPSHSDADIEAILAGPMLSDEEKQQILRGYEKKPQ